MSALPTLRTPEEVAEEVGGDLTGFYIRQLIKEHSLPHRLGRHRKVLLTPADVDALLDSMKAPAPEPETAEDLDNANANPFGATSRSAARHRRMAVGA